MNSRSKGRRSKSELEHRPRKRFGQNFLCDENIVQQIISAINPQREDHVVEIGPGLGVLTAQLLPQVSRLDAVELDRDLIPKLSARCAGLGQLEIHSCDALRFDYCELSSKLSPQLSSQARSLRIVGNLPYNISTPLLFLLLEQTHCIKDMHFMLQKEVVDRMTAVPNTSDYGRLSVMTQYRCDMHNMLSVPPSAFNPAPKVDSAVISMRPYETPPVIIEDEKKFSKVVTRAFATRRKTLRNNFKGLLDDAQWQTIDIDPVRRAETLSLQEFARLSQIVKEI